MPPKKTTTNGHNNHNGHVSLAREEYDAFVAREESYTEAIAENAKNVHKLSLTSELIGMQAKRMSETDLKITYLERVNAMQATFIDMLRADAPLVLQLHELSEFWRQWLLQTQKAIDARKTTVAEVENFEPDLFKTWRNWVNDYGKTDRVLGVAGTRMTRAEYDSAMPKNAREWQEHTIRRLRDDNAKLIQRAEKLEAEIESHKNPAKNEGPQQDTQQEKQP
jgi:hypothetical protein